MSLFTQTHPLIHELLETSADLKNLKAVTELLSWDQETYLTKKGAQARAKQLETLSGISHEKWTSKRLGVLLSSLEKEIEKTSAQFTKTDIALVKEMRREYTLAAKLPKKLVQELSKEESLGLESWHHAREKNNFALFAPNLKKLIALQQEVAQCFGFEDSPYDALLDLYEPGLTKKAVEATFEDLKVHLKSLIPELVKKTAPYDKGILSQRFEKEKIWDLSLKILHDIGFDLERGRQDLSTHPFTLGLNVDDVRITTRIDEHNPISTLLSSIHEAGHGMYEQGISPEITHTMLGYPNSLVIHESQSRLWENMVGKSLEFWEYLFPSFQALFPKQLKGTTAHEVWAEANVVKPSLIRVDADEVTYHMHIIIRQEIEAALIEGTLDANDVRDAWNQKYQHYLGVTVPNDLVGALQDIHWSQGLIGYFPTYSLGSLFSAQLFESLLKQKPQIPGEIKNGKFDTIRLWLNHKIHQFGRQYSSLEAAANVTGTPISSHAYIAHIKKKFQI